jgi:hypothetical protein
MTENYKIDNENGNGYYTTEINGKVGKEDYVSSLELTNDIVRQIFDVQDNGLLIEASIALKWKEINSEETYVLYDKENKPEFIVDSKSIKNAGKEMNNE